MAEKDTNPQTTSAESVESNDEADADDEWSEAETSWADSFVASSVRKLVHEDGTILWLWAGVEEPSAEFSITDEDEYAVELVIDGDVVAGDAFENEDEAEDYFDDLRARYPDDVDGE
jgi:hypothetical protein